MNIELLRQATAADHDAVEGAVPLMGEGLTVAGYLSVLQRMYGIVAAWERLCADSAPQWLQPMVGVRQRRALLEEDIHSLGSDVLPHGAPTLPEFKTDAELLGAMYVMEGSRLGGIYIARHVQLVLGLEAGRGDAYFRGHGQQTGALWKEFLEVLRTRIPDNETPNVIHAAKSMFQTFGEWMRAQPEPEDTAA